MKWVRWTKVQHRRYIAEELQQSFWRLKKRLYVSLSQMKRGYLFVGRFERRFDLLKKLVGPRQMIIPVI
jgi:hypothetical protein